MKSSDLIYAYPIALKLEKDEELSEAFVTFVEPNLFNEPYDNLGIKLAASGAYLVGLVGSGIQYSFVAYEVNGYAASFRTAINQLVSSLYFLVRYCENPVVFKILLMSSHSTPYIQLLSVD